MRLARTVLACLAVSTLAACGTDSVTAPEVAAPEAPQREETTTCSGTLVTVVQADGSVTYQCIIDGRGPMIGSGN